MTQNAIKSSKPANVPAIPASVEVSADELSCRLPLLLLFLAGAAWLVCGSVFGLIASIKFHSPKFLADPAWLTYGRVWPAYTNSLLYGFCIPTGLGVALWLFSRLGKTVLVNQLARDGRRGGLEYRRADWNWRDSCRRQHGF